MKLSFKIILPIILISALLILLAGCFGVPADEEPGYTPGTITGIIAAPCCSTSADQVSAPSGVSPEYWCFYCKKPWNLQNGVKVILTYGEDEIATTTTNSKGEFTFTDVSPGKNYVITALCQDFDDNRPLVKDVALELVEGGSFDTKITDLVSTSLGLVVDFLVDFTKLGPEDIVLDDVIADKPDFPNFPKFKKLVQEVLRVLEACQDVNADDDLQYALCRAAEEISKLTIGCGPGYTPGPTPNPCAGNDAPDITLVEYSKGNGFIPVTPGDTIHVIVNQSYTIRVSATDIDGKKDPLTYSGTVDGKPFGPSSSNQITVTPDEINLIGYSVSLSVYDGCTPAPWGPVTVVVDPITHTITASAGANGSITPSGAVGVSHGADQSFTITPDTNYHIADVLVDGSSVGAVASYAFTNVTADHTIAASFAINTHTITASAGANGSITPSGAVGVSHGGSQSFTMTPDVEYRILVVLVDGVSVGAVPSYTFTNVTADHTIHVTFELNPCCNLDQKFDVNSTVWKKDRSDDIWKLNFDGKVDGNGCNYSITVKVDLIDSSGNKVTDSKTANGQQFEVKFKLSSGLGGVTAPAGYYIEVFVNDAAGLCEPLHLIIPV